MIDRRSKEANDSFERTFFINDMSTRIIGWTSNLNTRFRQRSTIVDQTEFDAVVKEITTKGLLFSEEEYLLSRNNCVPVFDDYKTAFFAQGQFSQAMAKAHNNADKYAYLKLFNPSTHTYPEAFAEYGKLVSQIKIEEPIDESGLYLIPTEYPDNDTYYWTDQTITLDTLKYPINGKISFILAYDDYDDFKKNYRDISYQIDQDRCFLLKERMKRFENSPFLLLGITV